MQNLQTPLLGDYHLIKELDPGMLGNAFLAQHRYLKNFVFIKILPEQLARNAEFIQRFEEEIALFSHLNHPNIIQIQNASFTEGKYYLISDPLMDSKGNITNLCSFLQGSAICEEQVLQIARQIASALDYVHQQNVGDEPLAHRALKLNNILLDPKGKNLEVKITDFGLSRIVGISEVLSNTYKSLFEQMITVKDRNDSFSQHFSFLAPELKQTNLLSREEEVKADIFSFGVLIYYLLFGSYPEGIFPFPSQSNLALEYNWDLLILPCLDVNAQKRPYLLKDLIDKLNHSQKENNPKPFIKPQELTRPEYESDPSAVFQTDKTVGIYIPKEKEVEEIEPLLTEMVIIEEGTFLRGSNDGGRDEMPRHAVHLSSFAIDIHSVTNEQFVRFLQVLGGEKEGNNNDVIRLRDSRIRKSSGNLIIESGYAKHPVVGVSWYGALAYAKWVGKRLPTEAEWEIAACGRIEKAQYPTGEDIDRKEANFFNADTTSVMSYPPNEYGLYDIVGNVYEWCMDWYGYHYYEVSMQEPDNPKGPEQGVYRVLRGGCWKSLKEDMRFSHRHRNNPGTMNGGYGFRCAADVQVS